ncbi:MAG: hypothetical protein QM765_32820 [Myxococcales bacterium]
MLAARLGRASRSSGLPELVQQIDREYGEALRHDPRALVPRLARLCSASGESRLELAQQIVADHPESAVARLSLAVQLFAAQGTSEDYGAQLAAAAAQLRRDGHFWEALASLSVSDPKKARGLADLVLAETVPPEVAIDPVLLEALLDPGLRLARFAIVGTCL